MFYTVDSYIFHVINIIVSVINQMILIKKYIFINYYR